MTFVENFIVLFSESAPWLLLGLLIAGMMKWLIPMNLLQRHLGGSGLSSVIKAAIIGAPLPLCSCGVIPAAIGLRRSGASQSSTVSFLIATPETGVDSISISYVLLGPFMAIVRPFAAIFTAIYTGLLTRWLSEEDRPVKSAHHEKTGEKQSCCAHKQTPTEEKHSLIDKVNQSLKFSSGKLLQDLTAWLLIGLLLAAAIKTWVATDFLTQWGNGFVAMLVMAIVGIPMYICATASTPIAAGLLALGVSPGAVLVFMLAGPATNLSTMGMVRKEMGNRVLIAYLLGIFSASIGLGYFINLLVEQFNFEVVKIASNLHEHQESWVNQLSAILLAILIIKNWLTSTHKKITGARKIT